MKQFHKKLNFRDLGGIKCIDGRYIVPNTFYRSGGLYNMDEAEKQCFQDLKIGYILDLRTKQEIQMRPDPVFENIEVIEHSGLVSKGGEDIDFSPRGMNQIGEAGEKQLEALKAYYREMPFNNEAFQIMVKMIQENKVPLVFHCASGKDRTGVAAMILLFLLGCSKETVLADYLKSLEYLQEDVDRAMKKNAHLFDEHPVLKELTLMKNGVSEKIGRSVIEEIFSRYDSIESYFLNEFHLTSDDIEAIRNRYCA